MLYEILAKNRFLNKLARFCVDNFELCLLRYHKGPETAGLIRRTLREADCLLKANEAYMVYSIARAQKDFIGEMAEVGVYHGASAKLICEAKGAIQLHLFDTFEGLPETGNKDRVFKQGDFDVSLDKVRAYLSAYSNVFYYKGLFPGTAGPIENKKFSFVHLDVDLYESTAQALSWFYPRMLKGGVILSHDFSNVAGVKRAFDEFLADKGEKVIELSESQCMLIKRGETL